MMSTSATSVNQKNNQMFTTTTNVNTQHRQQPLPPLSPHHRGAGSIGSIPTHILATRITEYLLGHRQHSALPSLSCCPMIPLVSRQKADRSPLLSFDYSPASGGCLVPFHPGKAGGAATGGAAGSSLAMVPCCVTDATQQQQQQQQQSGTPTVAADGVCPYLSAAIPGVAVDKYILRALDHCHGSPECGILAVILMLRLSHSGPAVDVTTRDEEDDLESPVTTTSDNNSAVGDQEDVETATTTLMELNAIAPGGSTGSHHPLVVVPLSLWTFHRLFFSCFVLALKWLEDKTYVMGYYASVGGFPTSRELSGLEMETFRRLDFSIWPTEEEWTGVTSALGLHLPMARPILTSSCPLDVVAMPLLSTVPSSVVMPQEEGEEEYKIGEIRLLVSAAVSGVAGSHKEEDNSNCCFWRTRKEEDDLVIGNDDGAQDDGRGGEEGKDCPDPFLDPKSPVHSEGPTLSPYSSTHPAVEYHAHHAQGGSTATVDEYFWSTSSLPASAGSQGPLSDYSRNTTRDDLVSCGDAFALTQQVQNQQLLQVEYCTSTI